MVNLAMREKARDILSGSKAEIKNNPLSKKNALFSKPKEKKVTVITAAYNAERFIRKTIDSVISQSIGFDEIEYIIVDDCSTDGTKEIVQEYAAMYKNICLVSLKENTGSPGTPRNIGIELAQSKYVIFLDADDWFAADGVETLYHILEETGDDYAIGKTIKVESAGESVIGEFNSFKEKRSISPLDIPHFFYHMGPTARMMKLSIIKDHDLGFPDLKFGEDKWFFMELFFKIRFASTTAKPIYYVNRTNENSQSLTRVTNVLDKRRADLKIIKHIQEADDIGLELKKTALTRLYEYDLIKTCDSRLFVNAENKEDFIEILNEAFSSISDLPFDLLNEFKTPFYKAAAELFLEKRIEDFIMLFQWLKDESNKKYAIREQLPYYEIPFLEEPYRYIRVPILARALDSYVMDDIYYQTLEIYGDHISQIDTIVIRDRKRVGNEVICDLEITGNIGTFHVSKTELDRLESSLFTVFVRYNDYQLANVKRIMKNKMSYDDKEMEFYTTLSNNLGLKITSKN
ncbi:glycosyltransferase family 2 protein [Bacillus sp. MUM 13]|uniref:glycosyltransferase family 2 protein n=1 Tax=Bacillus sp. MUM 13 TaxID=1678001 RepID=UPI0008F5AEEE|nr:glycosyltransferase family 2 protein [Bacillus sp. MUM 13]OIK11446.1 hypothetical protein BIV59_12330 [Bacillus sp. MUM 13]